MSIEIGLSKLSHSVGVLYILRAENCPNYSHRNTRRFKTRHRYRQFPASQDEFFGCGVRLPQI